ncbi:OLC1v1024107C1 [Oldenlandia corymbosa var. corymbosa]|uniref:OLC1v1024107C1 n=1 Tax=Oldenlandia corymbosa var. corymbosa TaxID=529605 RepID=A0AAV1C3W4_OLDCO|nr:OLC1v1024107C1 [Oldenlandia corymbosa var. corymbosa]
MGVNQDRISSLPDDLLFRIVSLLPFKRAVKLSILSSRWQFISLGTNNLEFNESDFVAIKPETGDVAGRNKQREALLAFVLGWTTRSCSDNTGSTKFLLSFAHPEEHLLIIHQCLSENEDMAPHFISLDFELEGEFDEDYGVTLHRSLNDIYEVNTFTLSTCMLQKIKRSEGKTKYSCSFDIQIVFHCVLIVRTSLIQEEFYGITFFLNSCPNLEFLTIDLNTSKRVLPEYEPPPFRLDEHPFLKVVTTFNPFPAVVPYCVKKNLKKVVVEGFKGTETELLVLRYLLKYGRVLASLEVNLSNERAPDGTNMKDI